MSSVAGDSQQQQQQLRGDNIGVEDGVNVVMEIVLELVGRVPGYNVAVRRVTLPGAAAADRVKLVVDLPTRVGAESANLTAALVLDELDRLPPQARIAGILIASVQFTEEGAVGLQAFLASHAAGIRHVALHDVLPEKNHNNNNNNNSDSNNNIGGDDDRDEDASRLIQVCQAFASSPLQVLDVSRNCIAGTALWKVWTRANNLEQIILDGVTLDTPSWQALAAAFSWDSLEDLHVVLQKGPSSPAAMEAANTILRNCTRISSLRWVQRSTEGGPAVPCLGLREMAKNMLKVNTRGGSLRHLVLGGSFYPALPNADLMHARDFKDLCVALQDMPRLRTLKLRSLGITEVDLLVSTLRHTRPPLEVLDLSYNLLGNVQALLELSHIPKINKELRSIALSHNMIDTKQGRELFATFGDFPIDLTLDNNKVNFAALIRSYHEDLRTAERERDDWRAQAEHGGGGHSISKNVSADMVAEMAALKAENKRLRDERDVMVKAFHITGVVKQVDEQRKLLDRVQRLEDMVTLGAVFKPTGDRGGDRSGDRRHLDRRSSRRLLVGEIPVSMERLRSVSSRSIGSANRSHSNRSQSTAGMTEDLAESASTGTPRNDRRGMREDVMDTVPITPVRIRRGFGSDS